MTAAAPAPEGTSPVLDEPQVRHPRSADEFLTPELCHILEVWNRPDDPAISVARARVEAGVTTNWHRLVGIGERYLVIAGEGIAEVEGTTPSILGPGDLLYIPPGRAQRIRNTGLADLVFYALCSPRFVQSAYQDLPDF